MMRGTPRPTGQRGLAGGRGDRAGANRHHRPRPTVKLPCSFKAHSQATQRRWQHEAVLDLSAQDKAGICLDVSCPAGQPVQTV